jgi:hypothetical protein
MKFCAYTDTLLQCDVLFLTQMQNVTSLKDGQLFQHINRLIEDIVSLILLSYLQIKMVKICLNLYLKMFQFILR